MTHKNKYLIINADDYGLCKSVNEASISALKNGCVTSLSIMPCAPYFKHALGLAKKNKISQMGIHLTLTSEFSNLKWGPVTDLEYVKSLIDKEKYFWNNPGYFAENAKLPEIYLELENQIKKAIKHGIKPTHLDSHMFLLHSKVSLRTDFLPIILALCKKYKLPFRSPFLREYFYLKKNAILAIKDSFKKSYNIPVSSKIKTYNSFICNLKPGISELILHCGYDDKELKNITKYSLRRQIDYDFAVAKSTKKILKDCAVTLISWKEVKDFWKA